MTNTDTLELLRKLNHDHVIVTASLNGGPTFPLSDSPISGADAAEAVRSTVATADSIGASIEFSVRRDESALGVRW